MIYSISLNFLYKNFSMFQNYKWKNRLLIFYHNNSDSQKKIQDKLSIFIEQNKSGLQERKIKILSIKKFQQFSDIAVYIKKNGYGLYLIGLDGEIKAQSTDASLLSELFNMIDRMPMRRIEMKKI